MIRHPRYSDGSPVLIGDLITVRDDHPFADYIIGTAVVEIGWMPGSKPGYEPYPCVHVAGHTAVVLKEGDYELSGRTAREGDQA